LTVRLVTFACYLMSAWFIYLTTRRLSGTIAAAIAVLVFCLSPEIVQSSIFFSTEGTLYLGVAGMLYFLSSYWSDGPELTGNWLGLGLAVGIGLYSKITFISIAGPVLVFSAFTAFRNRKGISGLISLAKAGALALLIAVPWWRVNFHSALAYAVFGNKGWTRHSLGGDSFFMILVRWFGTVLVSLLGPGIAILIALVAIIYLQKAIARKGPLLKSAERMALFACAFAILPIVVAQVTGTNFNLRLISATMIPLAIAIGVLSGAIGWGAARVSMGVSGLLFFAQFVMLVFPVLHPNNHAVDPGSFNGYPWTIMIRFEQWDWKPLQNLSNSCGIPTPRTSFVPAGPMFNGQSEYGWNNPIGTPKISYMGNGRAFNGSQIQYPWIAQGAPPPDVTWLWKEEDGPVDWQKVLNIAEQSDVVITAPKYVGQVTDRQDIDNQYNGEFARRISLDPHFQGPIRLEMGQMDPVEMDVFVKSSHVCH
jgi:hypothetical protein